LPDAHLGLSAIYLHAGKTESALEQGLRARALSPDDWKIHWNLSMIYEKEGDIENALASAREAVRLQPDLPDGAKRVHLLEENMLDNIGAP
jgi:tetratricopeptide (TPR) repeat protein